MAFLENFLLKDHVALVTGGRRGIGRAIVMALAEAGADIAVGDCADENDELAELIADLGKMGRRCLAVKADVSNSDQVRDMVQQTMAAYGQIDILVNNAGISPATPPIPDLAEVDWNAVIDINLKGCYLCCRAVSRAMAERRKGSIINIASVEGLSTVRRASSPYGASKSGIVMLTRGLAWDLGPYNIRVNAIAPGYIKTEMTRGMWDMEKPYSADELEGMRQYLGVAADLTKEDIHAKFLQRYIPLSKMGQPSDVAGSALFLASPAAGYITGHTLIVDGGMLA